MLAGIGVLGLLLITGTVSEPSSRLTLTLFTTKRTWNEARLICEALGGNLLFMKNEAMEATVREFVSGVWDTELGSSDSFHLGLFNKAVSPSVMTWSDCEQLGALQYWRSSYQPYKPDDKPCVEYKTSGFLSYGMGWETVSCYTEEKFVCETYGGACEYDQLDDTEGLENPSHNLGAVSLGTCQSWCDTTVSQDMECWAFSWSTSSCVLHFAPDSSYFDATQHSQPAADVTLFTKRCIVGHVDTSTHVTASIAVTRPFSTCPGTHDPGNGGGKVYTHFDVNMTWTEAAQNCDVIGQQLLVVEDLEESLRLQETYGAASGNIWLGLNGSDAAGLYWVNGSEVTWDLLETGHPPPGGSDTVCGVQHPATNTWTTSDCGEKLPFVCQHTGPCLYEHLDRTSGEGGNDQGSASRVECETLCDGTPQCVGYTTYMKFLTLKCRLHVSTDPLYLFDPSHYTASFDTLYRRSCYAGASLQELPDNLGILQGVNVSSLSESSSITSVSSSMQTMSTLSPQASAGITTFLDISEWTVESAAVTTPLVDISEWTVESAAVTTPFIDISEWTVESAAVTTPLVDISVSTVESSAVMTNFFHISGSPFSSSVLLSSDTPQPLSIYPSLNLTTSISVFSEATTPLQDFSSASDLTVVSGTASDEILSKSMWSFQTSKQLSSISSTYSQASTEFSIQPPLPMSSPLSVQALKTTSSESGYVESPSLLMTDSLSHISTASFPNTETSLSPFSTSLEGFTTNMHPLTTFAVTTVSPDSPPSSSGISSSISTSITTSPSDSPSSTSEVTTTTSPSRTCPCKCTQPTNESETVKLVQEIRKKLLLEKTELTREIRRRTSAPDERPSAQNIGVVAVSFLSITFGIALLADAALLYTHLKMLLRNVFAIKPTQYR